MIYKLSPADFAFLYNGCKRCYYLKVVKGIQQPSIPLPGIFNKITLLLKNHYSGKRTEELHANLPPGTVTYGEQYVMSKSIQLPGRKNGCYISGRFDIVVKFDDGSYGVIDFKTSNPTEEHTDLYGRQLNAYAYALEHASDGSLSLKPITKLGLLYFHPQRIHQSNRESLSYEADIHFAEVKKDEKVFLEFINEVLEVLDSSEPPEASPNCAWCNYVESRS